MPIVPMRAPMRLAQPADASILGPADSDGARVRADATLSESSETRRGAWEIWLPIVLALALTVPGLGQGSLATDEALYAALAREAMERWPAIDLTLLGEAYGNKPPAGFWAMAVSIATFGDGAFAARLPSALAGAACCGLVASLALRAFGRGAGFVAGVCLALTLDWIRLGSQAGLDSMAIALGLLGVHLCVSARDREGSGRTAFAVAAGAAFGVAALVKGPLVVTPLVVGLALLRAPRLIGAALVIALVVGGSWPLAMHFSEHGETWRALVAREVVAHAQLDGGRDLPMLARGVLIRGAPASLAAVCGLYALLRRFQRETRIAGAWIGLAALSAVLPSPSYARYVLPLYPALAFLAGGAFRSWLAERPARLESTLRISRRVVAGAAIVAAALPLAFGVRMHRDPAALFAVHRDELALDFPVDVRVPVVGDEQRSESGTVALHMRRKVEHLTVEDVARTEPTSVLALGAATRAALVERGYTVAAASGQWALLRRTDPASPATPR